MVAKTARDRVHLVSSLDPAIAGRLGFIPVADAAEVVDRWRRSHGGEQVAVLTGQPVYPRPGASS